MTKVTIKRTIDIDVAVEKGYCILCKQHGVSMILGVAKDGVPSTGHLVCIDCAQSIVDAKKSMVIETLKQ